MNCEKGETMKKLAAVAAVFCLAWAFGVVSARCAEITPGDVAGKPDVFLKVVQEPNPLLLGHWGCTHTTTHFKSGETSKEPVEYWLVKVGDRHALHFYRFKRSQDKKYKGWREWTVKGDEITSPEIVIFVKDGAVHYQWKNDKPTPMTRIE
jgi:hypothetical protein